MAVQISCGIFHTVHIGRKEGGESSVKRQERWNCNWGKAHEDESSPSPCDDTAEGGGMVGRMEKVRVSEKLMNLLVEAQLC